MSSVAVIVGSAFQKQTLGNQTLEKVEITTEFGSVELHRYPNRSESEAYVLFRHGLPHKWLPNQIPYRAHTAALRKVGCQALLVTSSVGVLDIEVPLDRPLLVSDLLMPDNRLPDGSACTMFPQPTPEHGHLVLEEGLLSKSLGKQVQTFGTQHGVTIDSQVVFAYVGGPRTKSAAENRYWAQVGAQVNSMTFGPEVVLANEYEIPCAGVVVGHKYSVPHKKDPLDQKSITESLVRSHEVLEQLVCTFLEQAQPVPFANRIYRFHQA